MGTDCGECIVPLLIVSISLNFWWRNEKPCKESLSIKCLTVSATGQSFIDSEMKMNVGAFHCRFDTHEHSLP